MIKSISLLTRRAELHTPSLSGIGSRSMHPWPMPCRASGAMCRTILSIERRRADIATTEIAVDGVAELWYDDRAAMDRGNASPEAKLLHDDVPCSSAGSRAS